ncbi:hypothetical protein IW140_000789 [Coemansia sp. RSA 1813]|nr:hypothetical protein LPJ74_000573 [Coemansia sp. RSA 1843]KAJ2092326.1 hypothetical protein IW138_001088 [Coemansia sp. RSA 986]KAJ2217445.1 hypothetical protein EV179_000595 [Coemansia sp. RSA 487]KAJ2572674.1 hypothetical protein IW140_000789 [Coemansia sp. RSA 1813]
MKAENESLYGSSIYRGSQSIDDADLPEYMQLCRRLFPELMNEESDHAGLEAEENLARYLKYLTGLPLPSLKIEPTLLQNDLQRISNELTMLLLNETTNTQKGAALRRSESIETQRQSTHQLARQVDRSELESEDGNASDDAAAKTTGLYRTASPDDGDLRIFNVVYETGKAASLATEAIGASLNEAQEALSRLETACESFSAEMSHLDQRTKVIQRVLDKQDIITRIVELPRVMRMCVAGGYYEEAVEIAEHVRVTGDRLVRDIRDGVGALPGSLGLEGIAAVSPASKEQLIGFVGSIQRQVHAEFENMVADLCRELGYTRLATSGSVQGGKKQTAYASGLGIDDSGGSAAGVESSDDGYEKSIKRLSQIAKIVAILRSVGMFTEAELRLLYLRSRWQAWLQTAETLCGFAPAVVFASTADLNADGADTQGEVSGPACLMSFSPEMSRLSHMPEKNSTSSAEVSAYLEKLINAYLSWLAEADMHYRTLFARNQLAESPGGLNTNELATDPLTDLAIFSSRRFLSSTLPIFDLLTDASGISNLQLLVATHAQKLSRSNVDFVTPFLEQRLGERAFASIVYGVEEAAAEACRNLSELRESALSLSSKDSKGRKISASAEKARQTWEQLAVSTRPSLALPPDGFDANLAGNPSAFFGQYRVSPVGLLQYPLLAQLLHSFRDSLHTLRILVLAGDSARMKDSDSAEVLTLLTMGSIVLESELSHISCALARLCASVLDDSTIPVQPASDSRRNEKQLVSDKTKDVVKHACVAFVFGLARSVAEIFEEVASLSEAATAAGLCTEDDGLAVTLYSQVTYTPLLPYLL